MDITEHVFSLKNHLLNIPSYIKMLVSIKKKVFSPTGKNEIKGLTGFAGSLIAQFSLTQAADRQGSYVLV